ncbi:uncharacterized protein LOC135156145 [Lytechinus pictus]|uniref:uncharacterized protein LOC121424968 n=1 Tax=Lytechinus variegatus TaxID=7654 RepID=UPI001BB2ADE0|nr:uncharacterized protein LOC121424968 [Lytechinus variegatus]
MANLSSNPFVLAISRVYLALTLLGRSYTTLGAPTRAPLEYIETPANSLLQLHEYLSDATSELAKHSRNVYNGFRRQRFGTDADINPRTFVLGGLPTIQDLEETRTRQGLTEEDLLETHRANLGIYYQAMDYLISDEALYIGADDFLHIDGDSSTFYHIRDHIEVTLNRLNAIIVREGFRGENRTPVQSTLTFHTELNENFRNVRDLCVLFEIFKYTNDVLYADVKLHESQHRAEVASELVHRSELTSGRRAER